MTFPRHFPAYVNVHVIKDLIYIPFLTCLELVVNAECSSRIFEL